MNSSATTVWGAQVVMERESQQDILQVQDASEQESRCG